MDDEKREYSCCFFGHRKIDETPELMEKRKQTIEGLITEKNVTCFYFGSKSAFDDLCAKVVTELKEKYPHIQRIYVRSAYPDISDSYKDFLLDSYEDTYFPEKVRSAGKASHVERKIEAFCRRYSENMLPRRNYYN